MKRGFNEIMHTRYWDFLPEALQSYRRMILGKMEANEAYEATEDSVEEPILMKAEQGGGYTPRNWTALEDVREGDNVICVIHIEGPVLRNGDLCSFGSKEHRDAIMDASDNKGIIGFLFVIDSPGGSAMAKYDYEQAMEYARVQGKKSVALIDGLGCSAAYAVSALCDEIYYVEPHNVVGCIGTMCAMYTQKDGDVNAVTQERYAEIYSDNSPYKNLEYRNVSEGNYELYKEELDRMCADFQGMVKRRRPGVTEEQLKGGTFNAGETEGSLVDGQGDFDFCCERIVQMAGVDTTGGEGEDPAINAMIHGQQIKEEREMEQKSYPLIQAASGVDALEIDENEGFYMVGPMAVSLENYLQENEEEEKALASWQEEQQNLLGTVEELKNQIEGMKQELKEKENEIKTLSEAASQQPAPNDPPKGNASGEKQEYKGFQVKAISRNGLSWAEKAELVNQRKEELERQKRKR